MKFISFLVFLFAIAVCVVAAAPAPNKHSRDHHPNNEPILQKLIKELDNLLKFLKSALAHKGHHTTPKPSSSTTPNTTASTTPKPTPSTTPKSTVKPSTTPTASSTKKPELCNKLFSDKNIPIKDLHIIVTLIFDGTNCYLRKSLAEIERYIREANEYALMHSIEPKNHADLKDKIKKKFEDINKQISANIVDVSKKITDLYNEGIKQMSDVKKLSKDKINDNTKLLNKELGEILASIKKSEDDNEKNIMKIIMDAVELFLTKHDYHGFWNGLKAAEISAAIFKIKADSLATDHHIYDKVHEIEQNIRKHLKH